ncbi:class I SAM-dependent methyltransferase [Hwanghaeella grinnelliae]|uniref:class I SAM-dependent methyltransferase n=1 Tax=Hwanghaeella grinnelliae TaxID=2500179 RepID=UPI00195F4C42|nr:class I SAM-dependent methyltransferase [Hwanghaeella grinnelliae]
MNVHAMDLEGIYDADYWDRTYGGTKMAETFERIMSLPPEKSDNRARVERVDGVARAMASLPAPGDLLDVGSGLAVFPAAMREKGWSCVALDPDARGAQHARDRAGVQAVAGDFMRVDLDKHFDLITFNKVLEHVLDPVAMLTRAAGFLKTNGVVYVELPDGEGAIVESAGREEFFVEHYDAYSVASLSLLAVQAGLQVDLIERVREPSTKYTLRAFLVRPGIAG